MSKFQSTKVIELGSCAFRQPHAHGTRCQLLHGYKLTAKFWFGASALDERNWVVNFGGLKELKTKLNDQFDHTLTVAADDPLLPLFQQLHDAGGCDLRVMNKGVGIERVAEFCYEVADKHVREMTNNRCWVDQVEVFEHELNSATYSSTSTEAHASATTLNNIVETVAPVGVDVQIEQQVSTQHNPRAAHVGSNVSSGKGDWFAGTSWGNK